MAPMSEGKPVRDDLDKLTRDLTDRGLLIEAGWAGLQKAWLHPDSPPHQVSELRMAFFAGAQHLYASIMTVLDPGEEPTEVDERRIGLIADELERFGKLMTASLKTAGNA